MAERTTDRTRDEEGSVSDEFGDDLGVDSDVDGLSDVDTGSAFDTEFGVGDTASEERATTETGTSRVGRVRAGAGRVFSPASFVLQLVAALVGVFVIGNLIPLLPFAGFLGLLLASGLMGTLSAEPRYVEAAVAGGASGGLALFLGSMTLSVVTGGLLPALGAVVGAVAALGGFYAGRDLRDGLTRDL